MVHNKIRAYAAVKYPGCHLVFTGNNSAVVIPEEGVMVRIELKKRRRFSWKGLVDWLVPAVIWFWELWFLAALAMEFLI